MKQIELLAKLQVSGVDISVPSLSLLEGQKRLVTDIELKLWLRYLEYLRIGCWDGSKVKNETQGDDALCFRRRGGDAPPARRDAIHGVRKCFVSGRAPHQRPYACSTY